MSTTPTLEYRSPAAEDGQRSDRRQTFLYFGSLSLWIYLATPAANLVDIQTSFILKNQLNASENQISMFRLVTGIPVYFAFVFGLARDRWSPLGLRDRGYFLLFAPLTAAVFVVMASTRFTYATLTVWLLLAMVAFRFLLAAYQGLIALVGQEKLMSGRLSALWNIIVQLMNGAALLGSGLISAFLQPRHALLLVAAVTLLIAAQGLLKPRAVFAHAYDRPQARTGSFFQDVGRLLRHRAIYPAILINLLWNFAPGFATPLQFYLSRTLHAPDSYYSYINGVFSFSFIPTLLLFGWLCRRVPLNRLLWIGTLVALPQLVPLAFIHSGKQALLLAVPIGLMGGIASSAYYDLAMRSCPAGLQGTLMMLVDGVLALSSRGGDVLGTHIYGASPEYGFVYCVIATTAVYALILPLIRLVPKRLIATADGEPNPEVSAGAAAPAQPG